MKSLIALLFTFYCAFGFESVEILNSPITLHKSGYFATEKDLTPQEALQQNFNAFPEKAKSLGFRTETFWIRLDISSPLKDTPTYIVFLNSVASSCELFVFKNDQIIRNEKTGYNVPIVDRPIKTLPLLFDISKDINQTTYLIKVNSINPMYLSFEIGSIDQILKHISYYFLIQIAVLAISAIMILYNLFI